MNHKKILLITGASSGFGFGVAEKILQNKNYIVYVAARRVEKMQPLAEKGAKVIKMDITQINEVNQAVDTIIKEEGRIDVILSNAGYGSYGTIENVPLDEIQYQFDVNVFGMARLFQAVLPHMRKQKSGRIVMTNSLVSHLSILGTGYYAATKHALKAIGTALRQEVKDLGIDVVMIEPGIVKTEFDGIALKTLKEKVYPTDYQNLMQGFERYIAKSYRVGVGPQGTIDDMVDAITSNKPKLVYKTTLDSKILSRLIKFIPQKLFDSVFLAMVKKSK